MIEITPDINIKTHTLFLDHVLRMTDSIGMLEHCITTVPDKTHGYSIDDNARALQLMIRLLPEFNDAEKYAYQYLKYIISARAPEGFHNDLNADMSWNDKPSAGEWFGRSMAALGEASSSNVNGFPVSAAFVFDEMVHLISEVEHLRTKAQLIHGLLYRTEFAKKNTNYQILLDQRKQLALKKNEVFTQNLDCEMLVKNLADDLISAYHSNKDRNWLWFEDQLIYDNARLPLALFQSYLLLGNKDLLLVAKDSLKFLLEATYDVKKDCFSYPGCDGWYPKGGKKALFGQQPIEAGSTVEACVLAYQITADPYFKEMSEKAFAWYGGKNILNLSLIDKESQGICDGLEAGGLNPNQGAESILSYLLAKHALSRLQ